MKQIIRRIEILVLLILILTSCRTEDMLISTGPDTDAGLKENSNIASLIRRMVLNDGSNDNILDYANCFETKLPIMVVANGLPLTVSSEADLDIIEDIFNESSSDVDALTFTFPITIVFPNFTELEINDQAELNAQAILCNGENENDDDIECIDFKYPITTTLYNTNTEQTSIVTIDNDSEMHDFIEDLTNEIIVNILFPVTLNQFDGTEIMAVDMEALENIIDNAEDDCDEDDDFDYNDDNGCLSCSISEIEALLTSCSDWTVEKLERNDIKDLEDLYEDFVFNFTSSGITAFDGVITHTGTWSQSGSGNNIKVLIDIPTLLQFNLNWDLYEIHNHHEDKKDIDFRISNTDRLKFESSCGL